MLLNLRLPSVILFSFLLSIMLSPLCHGDGTSPDIGLAFDAINTAREKEGIAPLYYDEYAEASAGLHAHELAMRSSLSHVGLNGFRVADRYRSAGGTGLSAGENLGAGDTVLQIVSAWMDSPSHRKNLLNPQWRKIGLGLHILESGRVILVAVFTNSRWIPGEVRVDGDILLVTGECLLNRGSVPEGIFLASGTSAWPVTGVTRKNGGGLLGAAFEIPMIPEWDGSRPTGFSLVWMEQGRESVSDMMVLSP